MCEFVCLGAFIIIIILTPSRYNSTLTESGGFMMTIVQCNLSVVRHLSLYGLLYEASYLYFHLTSLFTLDTLPELEFSVFHIGPEERTGKLDFIRKVRKGQRSRHQVASSSLKS